MKKTIDGVTYKYTESIFGPKILEYVNIGGSTQPINSAEYNLDEAIISVDQFAQTVDAIHNGFPQGEVAQ